MDYQITIGLEIHVQLKTRSKMFCGCPTGFGKAPNSSVCPVCLGYPGAMPTMNREAVRLTIQSGLMLGCKINRYSKFDRKSYFYPDMPKNYQITQFDQPLCLGGGVAFDLDGAPGHVALTRIHLEEDVGKSMHFSHSSGVDFNRAGHPLMEIVTDPDMDTPEEAYAFLLALRRILLCVGVSDCNLEEGNMRCDVNCSVRPVGQVELGTKTELKNLNTFKGVLNSLKYESARQIKVVKAGGTIDQETRRWDVDQGVTTSMRAKEDAHDYRYFPEPDLLPVVTAEAEIDALQATLPELPSVRQARFLEEYGLPDYDAGVLVADKAIADYFERAAALSGNPKAISNWVMTEVMRVLSEREVGIEALGLLPEHLAELVKLVDGKEINSSAAKQVFEKVLETGDTPAILVERMGLKQVSDTGELESFVEEAIASNPQSVTDYRSGKKAAAQFLMGHVMRASRGKANPQLVMQLLREKMTDD